MTMHVALLTVVLEPGLPWALIVRLLSCGAFLPASFSLLSLSVRDGMCMRCKYN